MCFGTNHTISQIYDLEIRANNITIEVVDKYKYLGVDLDPCLTFSKHVDYLKGTITGRIRMLSKLRPILNDNTSPTLYKTLVLSILDYSDMVYDCMTKRDSESLQRLQNGACRIILKKGKCTSTDEMHKSLHLFRLVDRRHLRMTEYIRTIWYRQKLDRYSNS